MKSEFTAASTFNASNAACTISASVGAVSSVPVSPWSGVGSSSFLQDANVTTDVIANNDAKTEAKTFLNLILFFVLYYFLYDKAP